MIFWYVALFLVGMLFLLLLMLWMPLRLEIDTEADLFRLEWRSLVSGQWMPGPDGGYLMIRAPFFRRQLPVSQLMTSSPEKPKEKQDTRRQEKVRKKTGKRMTLKQSFSLLGKILHTVKIRRCRVLWDTDDFVLNAWLVPVFLHIRRRNFQVDINFQGKKELSLLLVMRPAAVIWVIFKQFIIKQ